MYFVRRQVTNVVSEHVNRTFAALLRLLRDNVGYENAPWLCLIACETGTKYRVYQLTGHYFDLK